MLRVFRSWLRRLVIVIVLMTSATVVRGADAPAPTTIRIADLGQDVDAQVFYAQELGIFKKYGIVPEVTIIRRGGGSAVAAAVTGGAVDLGSGDIVSFTAAHERGFPLVLLTPAAMFRSGAPTTEVIVAKDSPIKSAKDLEGKTIALISLEGPSRIATNAWLESNGATLDKISFTELPPINMGAAVERGTVAAAVISEPSLTGSQTCCRVLANNFESIGKEWLISGWYTTKDWLAKNPAVAKRFVLAMHEAAEWANRPANHTRSGEILSKYTPFPPDLLARMNRATYGETFSVASMQPILDAAFKYKAIPSAMAAQQLLKDVPAGP